MTSPQWKVGGRLCNHTTRDIQKFPQWPQPQDHCFLPVIGRKMCGKVDLKTQLSPVLVWIQFCKCPHDGTCQTPQEFLVPGFTWLKDDFQNTALKPRPNSAWKSHLFFPHWQGKLKVCTGGGCVWLLLWALFSWKPVEIGCSWLTFYFLTVLKMYSWQIHKFFCLWIHISDSKYYQTWGRASCFIWSQVKSLGLQGSPEEQWADDSGLSHSSPP